MWAAVCREYKLRSMNTDKGRCEGILQQVLSVTHPVCLCDHCLLSCRFISRSHTLTHTQTLFPQCYQRGPDAVLCPCQKVTGVLIRKPKIKGALFLLYVMIPCLCLALCKLAVNITHLMQSLKSYFSITQKNLTCWIFFFCLE